MTMQVDKARLDEMLLQHVETMQRMATAYLVPEAYTDLSGNRVIEPDRNHADHIKQELRNERAKAFASDMIYMLDGPEQRAAFDAFRSLRSTEGKEGEPVAWMVEFVEDGTEVIHFVLKEPEGHYSECSTPLYATPEAAEAKLRHPFRNVDESDWHHLFAVLPDTARGKFWKAVFTEARAALTRSPE